MQDGKKRDIVSFGKWFVKMFYPVIENLQRSQMGTGMACIKGMIAFGVFLMIRRCLIRRLRIITNGSGMEV